MFGYFNDYLIPKMKRSHLYRNGEFKTSLFFTFLLMSLVVALELLSIPLLRINVDTVLTVISIILVTNITALFSMDKGVLILLNKTKDKAGIKHYDNLVHRYKHIIYITFSFIILMYLYQVLFIEMKNIFSFAINYIFVSLFIYILIYNILLLKYYFNMLNISIDAE
tara:strand:- start:421 stop:921 length:501 start_codon:yes stop_codon:yes gene_type:complete